MQKQQPEKSEALTAATDRASGEVTQHLTEGFNVIDSKVVQVSSQPVFNFGEHSVRVVVRDGEPWFVASDVCAALDYKNTSDAVATHLDDDERMTIAAGDSHSNDSSQPLESKGKRGGARNLVVVNESGLYALVLRSRKPEARKFAKWVTSEVLPAIRKTGVYVGKPSIDYDRISPAQAQDLKEIVEAIVKAGVQGFGETWARLHKKFRVNSYLELPATLHLDARKYLIAKLPKSAYDGVVLDAETAKLQDSELLKSAFSMATEVASSALRTVFDAVIEGKDASKWDRWMFCLNHDRDGKAPIPWARPIQSDAMVVSMKDLPKRLQEPGGMMPTDEELANLAAACAMRLSARAASRIARNGG